jgi:hypothetical protein
VLPFTAVKVTNNVSTFIVGAFLTLLLKKMEIKCLKCTVFLALKKLEKIEKQKAMTVAKPVN